MSKGYFHVSSHGLEKNDIFKNREDFIQGMNDIAVVVFGFRRCHTGILPYEQSFPFCLIWDAFRVRTFCR